VFFAVSRIEYDSFLEKTPALKCDSKKLVAIVADYKLHELFCWSLLSLDNEVPLSKKTPFPFALYFVTGGRGQWSGKMVEVF